MGFSKELERSKRVLRIIKTLFFLIYMIFSFLIVSAPVLLVIADTILPSALFSASLSSSSSSPVSISVDSLLECFAKYEFSHSLVDIPLISIIRSAVIIIVYSLCDGPRLSKGPYLGITTICSVSSLVFVSVKASHVFNDDSSRIGNGDCEVVMKMALLICSLAMAVGHVIVAYRTSCRERRKLLVYKIDIEAVSAWKVGLPKYQKLSPTRKSEGKDQK